MKIRIFPGHLAPYVQKGGSWDETIPDPKSFIIATETPPIKGHYIYYELPDSNTRLIGLIDDVVHVNANTYVFISSSKPA